jgi:hypothetical protein
MSTAAGSAFAEFPAPVLVERFCPLGCETVAPLVCGLASLITFVGACFDSALGKSVCVVTFFSLAMAASIELTKDLKKTVYIVYPCKGKRQYPLAQDKSENGSTMIKNWATDHHHEKAVVLCLTHRVVHKNC